MHGDRFVAAESDTVVPVTDHDWRTEYLTLDLALGVVGSLDDAVGHISRFGTGHTEAIITQDLSAARAFAAGVDDAAAVDTPTDPPELFVTRSTQSRGPLLPSAFTTTKQIRWPESEHLPEAGIA